MSVVCDIRECGIPAVGRCSQCSRPFCKSHSGIDDQVIGGGLRFPIDTGLCVECNQVKWGRRWKEEAEASRGAGLAAAERYLTIERIPELALALYERSGIPRQRRLVLSSFYPKPRKQAWAWNESEVIVVTVPGSFLPDDRIGLKHADMVLGISSIGQFVSLTEITIGGYILVGFDGRAERVAKKRVRGGKLVKSPKLERLADIDSTELLGIVTWLAAQGAKFWIT